MADPLINSEGCLPIEVALAKASVDTTIKLLAQFPEGRQGEPAWKEAREATRALHLAVAGAEFDARLPARMIRNGGERIAAKGGEA